MLHRGGQQSVAGRGASNAANFAVRDPASPIYVVDIDNKRVQVFNSSGNYAYHTIDIHIEPRLRTCDAAQFQCFGELGSLGNVPVASPIDNFLTTGFSAKRHLTAGIRPNSRLAMLVKDRVLGWLGGG